MFSSRFARLRAEDWALEHPVFDRVLSPALVIHLDRVRANLRRVIALAGGDPERLRPHVKTAKIPEVFAEMIRAGLRRFKCATTREAHHLLRELRREGVADGELLLAYPLVGPALERAGELAREAGRTRLAILCEDPALVPDVPPGVGVFVDVNPGMNRTGVELERTDAIRAIARAAGPRFAGLHFYDGHVRGADAAARRHAAWAGYERLAALARGLIADGIAVGEIVTSGTPAFRYGLEYAGLRGLPGVVHRVSPGTVTYHDLRTEQELEDLDLEPAALVFSRVVSHPVEGLATCDAGSKSIAAEAGDPCAFVLGRPGLEALTPSEEHLPLRVVSGERPPRGARLLLIPRHVCPTVNLAEEALLFDGGEPRGVAAVRARAHELGSAAELRRAHL